MNSKHSITELFKTQYFWDMDISLLDKDKNQRLIYFDEVDLSDWPVMITDRSLKWSTVKKKLSSLVLEYTKSQSKGLLG